MFFVFALSKICATRCQILRLKCTTRWGSLQRSPDPLAVFKGPTSKGTGGEGREGKEGEGKRRGRWGRGREGKVGSPNWGVWIRQWQKLKRHNYCKVWYIMQWPAGKTATRPESEAAFKNSRKTDIIIWVTFCQDDCTRRLRRLLLWKWIRSKVCKIKCEWSQ